MIDSVYILLDKYNSLLERIIWIKTYVGYVLNISKRNADLFFRSTEIPRDSKWKDNFIYEFVEISDKCRKSYDELSHKLENNLNTRIIQLENDIESSICRIKIEAKNSVETENSLTQKINIQREMHKNAWKTLEIDPWVSEFELKMAIKKFFDLKLCKERNFEVKKTELEEKFKKFRMVYEEIVISFLEAMRTSHMQIGSFFHADKFGNSEDLTFYDAQGNVSLTEIKNYESNLSDKFYSECIDNISNDLKGSNIVKNLKIKKYFICKAKSGGFYRLRFLILSEHNFLHFFDLTNLEKIFPDFEPLIKKLIEIPSNKLTNFILSTTNNLNKDEEKKLIELTQKIFEQLERFNLIKNDSVFLKDKKTKINRNKNELTIFDRYKIHLLNFLQSKVTKIRGYLLKDLYELLFYLDELVERKEEVIRTISISEEVLNNGFENEDIEEEKEILMPEIVEDNPWTE